MHARRFYANTQSHSWNLVGSPATQHVAHAGVQTPREGLNETAYRSYCAMCVRLGQRAMTFAAWSRVVDKTASPTISETHSLFHEHAGDLIRAELQDHLTAELQGRPTKMMYDIHTERLRRDGRVVARLGHAE